MATRKTLRFILLSFLFAGSGFDPSAARQLRPANQSGAPVTNAVGEYAKWKSQTMGERGDSLPHFALATVTQRVNPTAAGIEIAAVGQLAGGFKLEVVPLAIQKIPGARSINRELSLPIVFGAGSIDQPDQADQPNPEVDSLTESKLIVPVTSNTDGLQIKWSFRKKGEEKRTLTLILPLEKEARGITFGFVDNSVEGVKGDGRETPPQTNDFGGCTAGCSYWSIYGGPSGCNVAKCCQDRSPILDAVNCDIICWVECWMPQ